MKKKPRKPDPWDLWEPVYDWELFLLRATYAPQAMPPVCIVKHGMKEGIVVTFHPLLPHE